MSNFKVNKSKGLVFSITHPITGKRVDFYRGLYSHASCVAEVDGREVYLSSPGCLCSGEDKDFPEQYALQQLRIDWCKHNYPHTFAV